MKKQPYIAIEEHWTTSKLTSILKQQPEGQRDESLVLNEIGNHLAKLEEIGDERIAFMDEQHIDIQILSLTPPATSPLSAVEATSLSREINDMALAAVSRHPSRFRAMSTLPMADPRAAVYELERSAKLGSVGIMVYGRVGERKLDDPCYDDVFAAAERLGQPIFIHPQIPSAGLRQLAYSGIHPNVDLALSTFSWGWHIEAATAVLRLIARGTFDRYPNLQLILGHWGELLLFWQDRTDSLARIAGLERKVSDYMRSNVYITSSGMFNPPLLRHALEATTIDRLLFSTDYPFHQPSAQEIEDFLGHLDSDEDRNKFISSNAMNLFKIRG